MTWTARSKEDDVVYQKGERVEVIAIEGVKLIVTKKEKEDVE